MPTYESLVHDYHALAFRVARTILRDDAAAEDAVQDVYLHFLQDPGALSRADNLRAFIARAAVNRALDIKRGSGRRSSHERAAISGRTAMDPIEAAARAELRAKVAELPDDQRLAVEMHYFHGLTKEETAAALQVASGTVSSRLNAALGRLRTVLAGAAFAGLLAMLESELTKCAAAEVVPGTLGERLLQLGKGGGSSAAVGSRKLATGVAGIAAAVFLAYGVATWMQDRSVEGGGSAVVADARNTAGPGSGNPSPASTEPARVQQPETIPAPPASTEIELEGFLFRRGDGVYVCDIRADDHMPKQTMWNQEEEDRTAWRESLTLAAEGALKGLPAPDEGNFGPFLLNGGSPDAAPRTRVRLRVRGAKPFVAELASDRSTLMSRQVFEPQKVELVAVLEKEVLSTAWLTAWRNMLNADTDLWQAWVLEPGAEKRTRVLDAATRLGQAWEAARAARAGDKPADWRIRRETEAGASAVEKLRTVGLDRVLPDVPDRDELHAALMDASSPTALRIAVVSRWGEEALILQTWCYRPNPSGFSWSTIGIAEAASMDPAVFDALKKDLEGIAENRPAPAEGPEMEKRRREEHARVAAAGLEVAELSSLDRERFIVDCGARVTVVVPGSAADRAGLRAGDILWKAVVQLRSKSDFRLEAVPVNGESGLAVFLKGMDDTGAESLELKVVRESGVESVSLGK